jgi:hypothetical protein
MRDMRAVIGTHDLLLVTLDISWEMSAVSYVIVIDEALLHRG